MSEEKVIIPGEILVDKPVDKPVDKLSVEELATIEAKKKSDKGDTGGDLTIKVDDVEYKLDDKGNALDDKGDLFKTKEELEKLQSSSNNDNNETKIEIDGVIYTVDDSGNAIDDNNVIKFTKDELTKLEEDTVDEVSPIDISKISDTTKLRIFDKNNKEVEYSNDEDGLNNYVTDVYTKGGSDAVTNEFNKLYETYPWLSELLNHVKLGGDLESFTKPENYDIVKLDKKNDIQLKNTIFKGRSSRGEDVDSINKYYEYLKNSDTDNDSIFDEATKELAYLKTTNDNKNKERNLQLELQKKTEIENMNNYWGVTVDDTGSLINSNINNSVYSKIKSRQLNIDNAQFKIPDNIRVVEDGKAKLYTPDDFFNYLYEPIVLEIDGKRVTATRDGVKLSNEQKNRKIDNDIYDAFLRFVNYDKSQFITEQINADKVKVIKKLKSNNIKHASSSSNNSSAKGKIIIK